MSFIDFDFSNEEDKITGYIHMYMTINGVMSIEKLVSILNEHHNFDVNESKVSDLVDDLLDVEVKGNNLVIKGVPDYIVKNYIQCKSKILEYRILDDLDAVEEEQRNSYFKVKSLFEDYITSEVFEMSIPMMLANGMDKKSFNKILKEFKVTLGNKEVTDLYRKFKEVEKDFRMWVYNGFSINELLEMKESSKLKDICIDEVTLKIGGIL